MHANLDIHFKWSSAFIEAVVLHGMHMATWFLSVAKIKLFSQ
jgi:hypothetical protein